MKLKKTYIINAMLATTLVAGLTACDNFLDKEPMSTVSPEVYFSSESQLQAYLDDEYPNILPNYGNWNYGVFGQDSGTDNQIGINAATRYTTDQWKVDHSESSNWNFERIYRMNYFLTEVLPKFGGSLNGSENTISGSVSGIKHYIGEAYFLRAYIYFTKELLFGDFPIIKEPLNNDMQELAEASRRFPRNEVARFIIQDLDSAYLYMSDAEMSTTRINKDLAKLLESRVALNEATWLQNFHGTAFVPGGNGWPGTDLYGTYTYPSGSIDNEITYFLDIAVSASKAVAEAYKGSLTVNTGVLQQSEGEAANPYYDMFASEDLSGYPEVLLWQQHARSISTHNINAYAGRGNKQTGLTRGFVQNFLMADGTPVYTHGDYATGDGYYMGDRTIADVRRNRDTRLSVFLKEPGQKDVFIEMDNNEGDNIPTGENGEDGVEPYPLITVGDIERGYSTGYALHKGGSFNRKHYGNGAGYTAEVHFRSAEALLNYMEAYYLRYGTLDQTAREYWTLIRQRAGVDTDFDKTISLTDMGKEAENDWGAYSGGELVDATLYNIRRERRCEYIAEGLRYMDLRRWRSMDQLIHTPCHLEGFHLWNTPMQDWYDSVDLTYDNSTSSTVSSPDKSEYLRPFEKNPTQWGYNGCTWRMAHYLYPIMAKQFQLVESAGLSTLYQNPYWPTTADMTAEQ
ncbi:MAG: RagB/SusD family nutrient uptake outer membrane protein [Prevotellaceae bacterium]|nr:RagB/SusD family nutrient uptake outer membrane protein [Prevotellaceae bacterium]